MLGLEDSSDFTQRRCLLPPCHASCQTSRAKKKKKKCCYWWYFEHLRLIPKAPKSSEEVCLQYQALLERKKGDWNWNDSHLSTPSTFPMRTSLTMAFWHSSHFNSPESITCPYWGRKDWAWICPKLKHNRCELPKAAWRVRLQSYPWLLASSSWGAQPWLQDTLELSCTKSASQLCSAGPALSDCQRCRPWHTTAKAAAQLLVHPYRLVP